MAMGHGIPAAFAHRAAPVEPGHFGVQPGLINKDQMAGLPLALDGFPLPPRLLNVGTLLLGGAQGFF